MACHPARLTDLAAHLADQPLKILYALALLHDGDAQHADAFRRILQQVMPVVAGALTEFVNDVRHGVPFL
jgi:hypothetical protein